MWRAHLDRVCRINDQSLIAKRFVKKQQMRWTPRGAHLLLQVRVHVLNDELGTAFQRWYPKLGSGQETQQAA
jgi:hypothetical protein